MTGRAPPNREAYLTGAMAIIAAEGLEALSLREVARRLGVSHQAPYKHFASRDHILAAVVARAFATFRDHLDARPRGADPWQDLDALGRAYVGYALEHALAYRLMFGTTLPDPAQHPEMMAEARHAYRSLLDCLARLPGADPLGERERERTALFIWSSLHGLVGVLRGSTIGTLELAAEDIDAALDHTLACIGGALVSRGYRPPGPGD